MTGLDNLPDMNHEKRQRYRWRFSCGGKQGRAPESGNLHVEDALDDGGHVVVFVFGKAATEDDVGLGICQSFVLGVEGVVLLVVHRVEGLAAGSPFGGEFVGDDGLGNAVDGISEVFEVLVLDDSGVGDVALGVVDHGAALVVGGVERFFLEVDGAVFQLAEAVAVEFINLTGEDDFFSLGFPVFSAGEEVLVHSCFDAFQQGCGEFVVTADGDALVGIVEVVVVVDEADGQAAYDEGRKLGAGASPLLFCVAFDEFLVDIPADEGERLLFQVAGLCGAGSVHGCEGVLFLSFDDGLGFCRCGAAPHLVEGVHVEGQVVTLAPVLCHGGVREAVEGYQRIHKVPHLLAGCVEDVAAVLVYVDAVLLFAVDVAAKVWTFVDDQTAFAHLVCKVGKRSAEKPGTDYEVVVGLHIQPMRL